MTMHINLIYEDEQRSASPVSLALALRLSAVVVVVLAVVGVFSFYVEYRTLQNTVRRSDEEWNRTEPKYRDALKLRWDLVNQEKILKDILGWRDARVAWGIQLDNLQSAIPSVVQLTELRVSQTVLSLSNNASARVFELRLTGKTSASQSEANVTQFLDVLKQPPLNSLIESAQLPPGAFRQDPLSKTDRIFEIVCNYRPRLLE